MKRYLIVAGIVALAALVFGTVKLAVAQTETPPEEWQSGYGHGMMGAYRGFEGYYQSGEEGPLHEYMMAKLAEAFGLSLDEIETRHEAGETMWQMAELEGMSVEEFAEIMTEVHSEVIDQAFADGILTQEEADNLRQHWSQRSFGGFGSGSGDCMEGAGGLHRGFRARWNTP